MDQSKKCLRTDYRRLFNLALLLLAFGSVSAAQFNVNTTGDFPDLNPGDGLCADADGNCSLRAAIEEAEANPDADVIHFDVDGNFNLQSPLPQITRPLRIDGRSAPSYQNNRPSVKIRSAHTPLFELSGAHGVDIWALNLNANEQGFHGFGISISHSHDVSVRWNKIRRRERAVHANNSCDLDIRRNDLIDSGAESWDGAIFIINLCETGANRLYIGRNKFGTKQNDEVSGIQLINTTNITVGRNGGSKENIELPKMRNVTYPLRLVNVRNAFIEGLDLRCKAGNYEGIGLRLLNCENVELNESDLRYRSTALQITNGEGILAQKNDFRGAGLDDDLSTILIEDFQVLEPKDLKFRDNLFTASSPTVLNLIDCSGIHAGANLSDVLNIELPELLSGESPIRIQAGANHEIEGIYFQREEVLVSTQGIHLQAGAEGVYIHDCAFEMYASGLNLNAALETKLSCNTFVRNSNGIWSYNDSHCLLDGQNSFLCNAIGIHNQSRRAIVSQNDFWGHNSGSSSFDGLGDYFLGDVSAEQWMQSAPNCMADISTALCQPEICDNGLDDDGDGVVDCQDASCLNSPLCSDQEEREQGVDLYPNPTSDMFRFQSVSQVEAVIVRDLMGTIVFHRKFDGVNQGQVDLSAYQNGLYIIEFMRNSERDTRLIHKVEE